MQRLARRPARLYSATTLVRMAVVTTMVLLIGERARTQTPGPPVTYPPTERGQWASSDPTAESAFFIDAPPSGKFAPPGWYMLTVVNSLGVPSVAKWVQVTQ